MTQQLTDPAVGLVSFQKALADGEIFPEHCRLDPDLYVLLDQPAGSPRFTYARIQKDGTVTAIAILAVAEPMQGLPCFQLGYAVPEQCRNQGRAKEVVTAALAELKHGFADANVHTFFVEAVVGADNPVSQAVAAATISTQPEAGIDKFAEVSVLQYVRKFEPTAV
ncbi:MULTISPECIES: N-acetyltransferase [unclassified Mesorhizobium]|uniref:GNAT family N-acetyltransferase n=2 Tax=Mesorhizobium TaxID=68287 RepID=UPI000FCBCA2E|nr:MULTISPECIES: N-acetyltransferase [unclassified Mesorhizobium]RUZ19897.1 N-acetyltransferase [Mesorhizobium sp. M7A.F.Ca.US.007.01.2.1]RUZ49887.1 N-acetyltransferase [Mesorhizobium sp. M7A.F.Ca.US.003.02.1.1]RUZ70306.1 N-acetyltransferase [Mesorhizobium sp. M7A.F.Ca.US.007.01.1.1]RUZ91222.1 N-acetyltransferase [Mesorhizobium sp. M7A.F.Ca.US.003.02.2.1]